MKIKQILETFQDVLDPSIKKYVCAPCSNCKGQLRDLFDYYGLERRYNIVYTGLAELIAQRHNTTMDILADVNCITTRAPVCPGQILLVPQQ